MAEQTIRTVDEALIFVQRSDAQMVDLKFSDLLGGWHHLTIPAKRLTRELFEEGLGFDGSAFPGWQPVQASDMQLRPDPMSARVDPFTAFKTVSFICTIHDPITGQPYSRDPRYVAQKAHQYMLRSGVADEVYFGPEAEFFIFDDIRFELRDHRASYAVDSIEGAWNTGRSEGPNLGYKVGQKRGYSPVPPTDSQADLRAEIALVLEESGIAVDLHHHEVASGGQAEIGVRFNSMLQMADDLQWFKYIVKNVARRHGKVATFMPKPLFGDNGSGMHTHISLWRDGAPLFAGDRYGGLSEQALHFIGGILEHAPALVAFTNPTTNSFKRLVPGFDAPINLAYSSRNRSAALRIPTYSASPTARRVEFRTPDPAANSYLAFAAILLAGLDGIERQIDPGSPLDKDIYNLPPEELADIPRIPASLEEALLELAHDHEFLLKADVFTEDIIESWIDHKLDVEIAASRARPTPLEFSMYFGI